MDWSLSPLGDWPGWQAKRLLCLAFFISGGKMKEVVEREVKPGVRTSEFWVTLIMGLVTAVVGVMVAQGVLSEEIGGLAVQVIGLLVVAVVPIVLGWLGASYIHSRTTLKLEDIWSRQQPGASSYRENE